MSTSVDHPKTDLDRTDELPVLDVAAYEASLAENDKALSRTDAWSVEPVRDFDVLAQAVKKGARTPQRNAPGDSTVAQALTVNVERILKRIADLEADVTEAHEANAALQKRSKTAEAERDQQAQRVRTLEGENARFAEHRALAEEMTRRAEEQLRGQTQRAESELKQLVEQRAQAVAALEKTLDGEKAANTQLARQLAAKLHDYERMASLVEHRERAIEQLTQNCNALTQRLQQEEASTAELSSKLTAAEQARSEDRALLQRRENALSEMKKHLAQVGENLDRSNAELESTRQQRDAGIRDHASLEATHDRSLSELREAESRLAAIVAERDAAQNQVRQMLEERESLLPASNELAARTAELERSQAEVAQLQGELAAARAEIGNGARLLEEAHDELADQRAHFMNQTTALNDLQQALQERDEIAQGLTAQLKTAHDEQAIMSGQLTKLRTRVKSLSKQLFSRDHQIVELQADLAVHTEALDAIRRDINRIGGGGEEESFEEVEHRLEPIDHAEEPVLLNARTFTVGRTSDNDICIPSHLVSRHHARLLIGPTGVILEDSGSTNGCFVNGEQVHHRLLHDGDVLEIGDMRYRLVTRSAHDTKVRTPVAALTVVPTLVDKSPGGELN